MGSRPRVWPECEVVASLRSSHYSSHAFFGKPLKEQVWTSVHYLPNSPNMFKVVMRIFSRFEHMKYHEIMWNKHRNTLRHCMDHGWPPEALPRHFCAPNIRGIAHLKMNSSPGSRKDFSIFRKIINYHWDYHQYVFNLVLVPKFKMVCSQLLASFWSTFKCQEHLYEARDLQSLAIQLDVVKRKILRMR